MFRFMWLFCGVNALVWGFGFSVSAQDPNPESSAATISYYRQIQPIFQRACHGCHQPARPSGGYVMTDRTHLLKAGDTGLPGVIPGDPQESSLVLMVTAEDGDQPAMPKGKDPLQKEEIELISQWILQGALDDTPDSAVRVYDAEHPPTYTLPPVLTSLDYSPDGKWLAVSGFHEVLIYDTASNQPVARLIGLSPRIQSLSFSPDGKWLAVTGGKPAQFGEIQIWDVAERLLKLSLTLTFDTIFGVSWSPDGKLVSFGCTDNSVRAIEIDSGKQVLYQGAHGDWVLDTTFSVDASHLVSVSRDRSMKLTQVATERFVDNITSITPGALKGGLMTVRRNPLSDELLVGGADGIPKIYQMYRTKARRIGDDFNLVRAFEAMPGRIFAVDFSKDGELITAGSSFNGKGEVRCYNTVDGKRLATFEGQRGPVYSLRFHPSGGQVASGGFDGVVRINDSKTGKLLSEFVSVPIRTEEVAKKSQ